MVITHTKYGDKYVYTVNGKHISREAFYAIFIEVMTNKAWRSMREALRKNDYAIVNLTDTIGDNEAVEDLVKRCKELEQEVTELKQGMLPF